MYIGFPDCTVIKNLPARFLPLLADARDVVSVPGLGRSPGGGNGSSLQYSCLENSVDRAAWWATVHGAPESDTTEHKTRKSYSEVRVDKLPIHVAPQIISLTF